MIAFPLDPALDAQRAGANIAQSESPLERRNRRVGSFHPSVRPAIAHLTANAPEREDLADSFPALLFALVTGFATPAVRETGLALVDGGASLRDVAAALKLPVWLRRLPPGAFAAPLPPFALDAEAVRRMAPLVPADDAAARIWLDAVIAGWRGCSEDFAAWIAGWIARQPRYVLLPFAERNLRLLAAWAWHAGRPETFAHRLLRRPWTPATSHRRALDEVVVWRQRIDLALVLAARGDAVDAPAGGTAMGYEFRPLETAEDFVAEADIMDNCLDQFADRLASRFSRVYSVRRDGRSVANVEIGSHDEEASMPAIRQLRAVRNRRAPPDVWQATYAWLGAQPARSIEPFALRCDVAAIRAEARRVWDPYLEAVESRWPAAEYRAFAAGMIRADVERAEGFVRVTPSARARRTSNRPA